jgi:large subunit ribosomal protein L19e
MKLDHKKKLAAKVLCVGKAKVVFVPESLEQIKEAITRQDILDLYKSGAIQLKEDKGRRKVEKRKHRRGQGKVKKRVNRTKQDYVKLTRKLRASVKGLQRMKKINVDEAENLRKMIRASRFKSRRHMLDNLGGLKD